jgi:hypothetical protein
MNYNENNAPTLKRLEMLAGECWYTNVNFVHSVANKSSQDRIHLVIDGERNDWSDQLFFSLAPKEGFNLSDAEFSLVTKRRMIEELKFRNEPESQGLIRVLESDLGISSKQSLSFNHNFKIFIRSL